MISQDVEHPKMHTCWGRAETRSLPKHCLVTQVLQPDLSLVYQARPSSLSRKVRRMRDGLA